MQAGSQPLAFLQQGEFLRLLVKSHVLKRGPGGRRDRLEDIDLGGGSEHRVFVHQQQDAKNPVAEFDGHAYQRAFVRAAQCGWKVRHNCILAFGRHTGN